MSVRRHFVARALKEIARVSLFSAEHNPECVHVRVSPRRVSVTCSKKLQRGTTGSKTGLDNTLSPAIKNGTVDFFEVEEYGPGDD